MGKFRGTDTEPGWINRRLAELDRKIMEQAAAKRMVATEIPSGGNFIVRGLLSIVGALDLTGTLSMKSEDGVEIMRAGQQTFGRGIAFARDDATSAYILARAFSNSTVQTWGLFDRNGTAIVSEEPLAAGLARPRLEHPFQPVAATSGTAVTCGPYGWERTTTSATYETLFCYDGRHQNAFLDLKFAAVCSDGTTAGDVRVVDLATNTQLGSFIGVPWAANVVAGTTTLTVVDPAPAAAVLPGAVGDYVRLGVQVRRTAGAGSITVAVASSLGG